MKTIEQVLEWIESRKAAEEANKIYWESQSEFGVAFYREAIIAALNDLKKFITEEPQP